MKGWKDRIRYRMQNAMSGRNGMDELCRDVYVLSLILFFADMFIRTGILYSGALIGFGYSIFRVLSRKIFARQRENQKYIALKRKCTGRLHLVRRRWKERKTHRFYTCRSCHQAIRVPKGKGKIEIRCPKCGAVFIKKT